MSMDFSVLKDCCKRHLIAPTGLEPVYSIAVRNTSVIAVMFPPVYHNRQLGRDEGRNRTADTCLDDWNEIAAEITNMICIFISLLYHLSYLAMWHVLLICKDVCAIALNGESRT